jgi:flagellar biosynthesis/type III secretory pathway protein FliH
MTDNEVEPSKATNDLDLDAVVHLDEAWHQEGFEEGKEAGRQRGHKEGKAVGYVSWLEGGRDGER